MNLKIITTIAGYPCNLVKAEEAQALLDALAMAKNWIQDEKQSKKDMHPHDRAIYDYIMESIDKAIQKATQ